MTSDEQSACAYPFSQLRVGTLSISLTPHVLHRRVQFGQRSSTATSTRTVNPHSLARGDEIHTPCSFHPPSANSALVSVARLVSSHSPALLLLLPNAVSFLFHKYGTISSTPVCSYPQWQMIDLVEIDVVAGRGGNGAISFRREKFVPRGGPDGGDGGRGGDVTLVATASLSTLRIYRDRRTRQAGNGKSGARNRRHGAAGGSIELSVPVGSVVWDITDESAMDAPLTDLDSEEASFIVARGGRGGWGNRRFARATRQSPHFAQQGAAGERRRLRVELKLLADVGLVGLPNAGKSTLLRAWSAATPKVGGYAFTTLEPELGVVEVEYDAFVAADMPGLIEGASRGVGLGHEFLRHIERTRVLVHVLDMTREDPIADLAVVEAELKQFGHGLAEKPRLLALNKIDDPDGRARMELLAETDAFGGPWVAVSSLTREGTPDLARRALETLRSMAAQPAGDTAGEPPGAATAAGAQPLQRAYGGGYCGDQRLNAGVAGGNAGH